MAIGNRTVQNKFAIMEHMLYRISGYYLSSHFRFCIRFLPLSRRSGGAMDNASSTEQKIPGSSPGKIEQFSFFKILCNFCCVFKKGYGPSFQMKLLILLV